MKKIKSYRELMNHCSSSGITSTIPDYLSRCNLEKWKFMYGFIDGDSCRAEFVTCPEGDSPAFRASWHGSPHGERGYMEPLSPARTAPSIRP